MKKWYVGMTLIVIVMVLCFSGCEFFDALKETKRRMDAEEAMGEFSATEAFSDREVVEIPSMDVGWSEYVEQTGKYLKIGVESYEYDAGRHAFVTKLAVWNMSDIPISGTLCNVIGNVIFPNALWIDLKPMNSKTYELVLDETCVFVTGLLATQELRLLLECTVDESPYHEIYSFLEDGKQELNGVDLGRYAGRLSVKDGQVYVNYLLANWMDGDYELTMLIGNTSDEPVRMVNDHSIYDGQIVSWLLEPQGLLYPHMCRLVQHTLTNASVQAWADTVDDFLKNLMLNYNVTHLDGTTCGILSCKSLPRPVIE